MRGREVGREAINFTSELRENYAFTAAQIRGVMSVSLLVYSRGRVTQRQEDEKKIERERERYPVVRHPAARIMSEEGGHVDTPFISQPVT